MDIIEAIRQHLLNSGLKVEIVSDNGFYYINNLDGILIFTNNEPYGIHNYDWWSITVHRGHVIVMGWRNLTIMAMNVCEPDLLTKLTADLKSKPWMTVNAPSP